MVPKAKPKPKSPTTAPAEGATGPKVDKPPGTAAGQATPAANLKLSAAGIKVSGIMRGLGGPVAIINNRFIAVGKTIGKAKVVRIGQFSVELEIDGERFLIGVSAPSTYEPPREEPAEDKPAADAEPEQQEQEDPDE
ncbi:unnamed protein product [marine sediment metagenome]|uniref:Uncharacterized protein n=1 Tax=marine sediment metagenome TaxID=412755 RepID=X0ZAT4_9ZZZZ